MVERSSRKIVSDFFFPLITMCVNEAKSVKLIYLSIFHLSTGMRRLIKLEICS